MPADADQAFDIGLHQDLQHRLGHGAQEVAVAGLLHQLGQCQSLLGHRGLPRSQVKPRNSTLAERPDDHLAGDPAARLRQTRGGRCGAPPPSRISTTSEDANEPRAASDPTPSRLASNSMNSSSESEGCRLSFDLMFWRTRKPSCTFSCTRRKTSTPWALCVPRIRRILMRFSRGFRIAKSGSQVAAPAPFILALKSLRIFSSFGRIGQGFVVRSPTGISKEAPY